MKRIFFVFLVLFSGNLYSESIGSIRLSSTALSRRSLSNSISGQTNDRWNTSGSASVQYTLSPEMGFSDEYVNDARLDVLVTRSFDTNSFNTKVLDAYVDLFYRNLIGLKLGFQKVDFSFANGYFHPLNIIEFVPGIRKLYDKIVIGGDTKGYAGVPACELKLSLPEWIDGLNISLSQNFMFLNTTNFDKNYWISSLKANYSSFNITVLTAYYGDSWSDDSNRVKPVVGANFTAKLPGEIFLFAEALYKTESYRGWVSNTEYIPKSAGDYINSTVRLEYTLDDVLNSTLSMAAEYFYYGEGWSRDQISSTTKFLENQTNALLYFSKLYIPERYSMNSLELAFGVAPHGIDPLSVRLRLIYEYELNMLNTLVYLSKPFDNLSLAVYLSDKNFFESKNNIFYAASDIEFGGNLSISL